MSSIPKEIKDEQPPANAITASTGASQLTATMSSTTEIMLSIIAYSFCSGSMVLVNKLILHHMPFPSLVMTAQLWFTLLFIFLASTMFRLIPCDPLKWEHVKPYLLYTVGFSLGIYCNMRSLAVSNVETVIVFRAMAPLLVSVADALCLGREWPSKRSWGALLLVVFGAYLYATKDKQFQSLGPSAYFWPTAYLFIISFEMAYGKQILKSVNLQTKSGPVLYANMLGWPPMILFATLGHEFTTLSESLRDNGTAAVFPASGLALLLVGCVVGTGIGYSGWWCRSRVSATSYTVIGVMNKCLTVLANYMIWDQHASGGGIASLGLCLLGGVLYRQAPMARKADPEEDGVALLHGGGADVEQQTPK